MSGVEGLRILSLCDYTGNAVIPWVEAGATATLVDLRHPVGITKDGEVTKVGADVLHLGDLPKDGWDMVFAFPPCTHLAISGARWFKGKGLVMLAEAIQLVAACAAACEDSGAPYMIENPVGTLSTYWRKPDFRFDPCDFAGYLDDPSMEAYTKRTCLWVGGGFVMPEPRPVEPVLGSLMHTGFSPGNDRGDKRSVTPMGFAEAVFQANSESYCTTPQATPVAESSGSYDQHPPDRPAA